MRKPGTCGRLAGYSTTDIDRGCLICAAEGLDVGPDSTAIEIGKRLERGEQVSRGYLASGVDPCHGWHYTVGVKTLRSDEIRNNIAGRNWHTYSPPYYLLSRYLPKGGLQIAGLFGGHVIY